MEFTQRSDRNAQYKVIGPVFFNDDVIGVLDGKYVQGTVGRQSATAFRVDRRTSFKHPIIGTVLGAAMAGVPLQSVAGDPLGLWWLTLASPGRLIGSFFMFCFGAYLLWGVLRRRDLPWLVLTTSSGERAFPLREELPEAAAKVLRLLITPAAHETSAMTASDAPAPSDPSAGGAE